MPAPIPTGARLAGLAALALILGAAIPGHTFAQPAYFDVVRGSGPHDVAAAPQRDGPAYYTGQRNGTLGILDPATGKVDEVPLGSRSAPHGVIVGPDGAPWIIDSGLNAIVRFDPSTERFTSYRSDRDGARVRQMLGRTGEAWGAESGTDRLVRIRPSS